MDRSAFLDRVRTRLAGTSALELPEELPRTMVSGDARGFDRFAEELAALGGEARRVAADALEEAVGAAAHGCARAVVGADLGPYAGPVAAGLLSAGCVVLEPGREGAEAADLGVTGAAYGVAATGSVLLSSGPGAPRTTGLLPERHLVILPRDRLLPGLEELIEHLPAATAFASQMVLVTGPSRTSDIEMTPVLGVHGPERVIVLVVGE
jgi:L-lactate utilization protein LutC